MEYDALPQTQAGPEWLRDPGPAAAPPRRRPAEEPLWIRPLLTQPGGSQTPQGAPLYILDRPGVPKLRDSPRTEPLPKDDVPPALPPRNPRPLSPSCPPRPPQAPRRQPVHPRSGPSQSGPFQSGPPKMDPPKMDPPKVDPPKLGLNYDNITTRCPDSTGAGRGRGAARPTGTNQGSPWPGVKPSPLKSRPGPTSPSPRATGGSAGCLQTRTNGFGYELFQVSEERDEEVAAFCHMLDVLRSADPHSGRSRNRALCGRGQWRGRSYSRRWGQRQGHGEQQTLQRAAHLHLRR
ncbi:Phosphatidylinositol 4-phosphate 3-kinase C2 domain containing subunit beta [Dissostichus eleginoides]|uniref:Phosphatidylinositol 4-phosphate 3-kinase C2 domain containing subunit beta n=1 Tax=Dissostichus eleginoides TaxID=100907 RepID=A0AAD9CJ62_DISEL|nr:Phosphatidylinositol 4-phosphate 3-kinase C2 domain containing subunit beta [Dissostichus eleginoides]